MVLLTDSKKLLKKMMIKDLRKTWIHNEIINNTTNITITAYIQNIEDF